MAYYGYRRVRPESFDNVRRRRDAKIKSEQRRRTPVYMQVTACCFRKRITVLGLLLASFMFIHDRDNYCLFYLDIKSELSPSEPRIILLADSTEISTTTMLLDAEGRKEGRKEIFIWQSIHNIMLFTIQ